MKLEDVIAINSIETGIDVKNKKELLGKMVDLAFNSGKVINKIDALKDIFEREKLMSTGIGKGIALPHAKTNSVSDTVGSFVILRNPVDFESLDGQPVSIVFLLLGRESNVGLHLRILSKISRILNNDKYKNSILNFTNSQDIINFFKQLEEDE